jgi:hypothetical protein
MAHLVAEAWLAMGMGSPHLYCEVVMFVVSQTFGLYCT